MVSTITFILYCKETDEYYCSKTNDLLKELVLLKEGSKGRFFRCKERREFELVFVAKGDFENNIKHFGQREFMKAQEGNVKLFNVMIDAARNL